MARPLESGLNPDRETNKLSIKTALAISIKTTVIINETKDPCEEMTVGGESKTGGKGILSKMHIRRYSTLKEFKHQVEQVEVDFFDDDDSDKEDSTKI
jgi:hypothetical protein